MHVYAAAIRPGRPWPTQMARVIPMIPTYTTSVSLPKICLAFEWPIQMKIPRTAPDVPYMAQLVAPLVLIHVVNLAVLE